MFTKSHYGDGVPVPVLADKCKGSTKTQPKDTKAPVPHSCKLHTGHESADKHRCICGVSW